MFHKLDRFKLVRLSFPNIYRLGGVRAVALNALRFDYTISRFMFSLVGKFARHVLPGVIRPLHVLWNEVIGFIFLVLAALVFVGTLRRTHGDHDGFLVLMGGCGFGLMLAWFGISSFLRARKISRS